MKIKRKPNLKGYITVHRSIQQLLPDKKLNFTTLGAYIAFVLQADWDSRHNNYTCLTKNDAEVASEWGVDSATVWRQRKRLTQMGLLAVRKDGLTHIKHFKFFEHEYNKIAAPVAISPLQENTAEVQENIEDMQDIIADLQVDKVQKSD